MDTFDPSPSPEARARFMAKVDTSPGRGKCWPWRGGRLPSGHGMFNVRRSDGVWAATSATRFMVYLMEGPFPAHLFVRHMCDNPCCVNPEHLRLGTQADNMQDRWAHGRYHDGEPRRQGKLDDNAIIEIRRRALEGETYTSIARDTGLTPPAVGFIATGRTWSHVPGEVVIAPRRRGRPTKQAPHVIAQARRRAAQGESIASLAAEYGVKYNTLLAAVRGSTAGWAKDVEGVPPVRSKR